MEQLSSFEHFKTFVDQSDACIVYFSHDACNVCKVLKPKILEMCEQHFPLIRTAYADTVLYPEIAGQNGIFTVPAILIFFDRKEYIRSSRNISVTELKQQISRYYNLMF